MNANQFMGRWTAQTLRRTNVNVAFGMLALLLALLLASSLPRAQAAVLIGDGNNNVLAGRDNDNVANTFLQPVGVAAKQHMEDTDLLLGGYGGDLLIGLKGGDVLDGGAGHDITIGGVENFVAPNSDVVLGGDDTDINIWAPGDGSDLYVGGAGHDTHISAPLVLSNGKPQLYWAYGRQLPRVSIDAKPQFKCTVEAVPTTQQLGVQYITRFFANGNLAVTIRLKDVEQVLCPSPNAGKVLVANLASATPTTFVERPLSWFSGTVTGAIIQAP